MRENIRPLLRLANWRVALILLLAAGVLGMQPGQGTLAFFTSTAGSTGNTFTAGQLRLLFNGSNPTGAITFDTSTTTLKPSDVRYGYFTVQNDNATADAVPALFGTGSQGTVTIQRDRVVAGASNATNADALDTRMNILIKDASATAAITSSATCATNWTAGSNVTLTQAAPLTIAPTTTANRTALTTGTATTLFTDATTIAAGATKKYCMQFTWVNGTPAGNAAQLQDNTAKQGSNIYTVTFTAASQ